MFDIETYIEMYNKHREKILYLIFGFLTVVINLGTYKLFLMAGIHYLVSINIAFIIAVLFAFFTNRYVVFTKGKNVIREIVLFYGARIFTQLLNNIGLYFMVEILIMDEFISQVIISGIVIILNYIISKYAIFINK